RLSGCHNPARFGVSSVQRVRAMVIAFSIVFSSAAASADGVERRDSKVPGEPGITLFVREVRAPGRDGGVPVLLVHGARVPGVASCALPAPGGSLAADLATAGHRVFVMDVRGYGGSTRPPGMDAAPEHRAPLVRSDEAVRDLASVAAWIRARTGKKQVAVVG